MKQVISERYYNDDKSHMTVVFDFDYHGVTYKGSEITDISKVNFDVSYNIELEMERLWNKRNICR